MRRLSAIVMVLVGCETKTPRYEGPLRLDFGDCATDLAWVSGPRPLPLDKRVARVERDSGGFVSGFDDSYYIPGSILTQEPAGGFNRGTGTPTIPDGSYTMGRNDGFGVRPGIGMRGRTSAVPTVRIGQPIAQGDLDKAIIRRYIKRNIQKLQYCYEKELLSKPKLGGTLEATFTIAPTGTVSTASASGVDPVVSTCVAGVIKNIEFPKPKAGGTVQVTYPFTLTPVVNPSVAAGSAGPNSAAAKPEPKPAAPAAAAYKPGAGNPLVARREALEECLRASSKPYGALVVRIDWTGGTANATVYGAEDHVAECVSAAVRDVRYTGDGTVSQSCSIAFGTMPAADLPGVDITDTIKYGGQPVVGIAAVVDEKAPTFKLDALFEKVDAGGKRDRGMTTPISLIGPLVVRPLDTTPITVVNKVNQTLKMAGANFVFAADRAGTWRLLDDLAMPVVPVPRGTGGTWNPSGKRVDPDRVQLSILVQKGRMWVGLSRTNESYEIPNLDRLEKVLAAQKKSAIFADRTDVEIAGELVSYREVVKAIEVARDAGFVDWVLLDPVSMSARPKP